MNAQLLGRVRGGAQVKLDVPAPEAILGRDSSATLAVPMDGVSRRHARIVLEGDAYWIQDLGSTNGTFVNGAGIAGEKRERLRHLDVITLGREAELLFVLRERKAVAEQKRRAIARAVLVPEEGGGEEYEIAVGEATIGRTAANNVVLDKQAISKMHARIQRSADQLVVQDLSSVNGTFVNGARVMTALLQDGDRLSFANVVAYRVRVEWGDVLSSSGIRPAIPLEQLQAARAPEPEREWKTRYEWDTGERAALAGARAQAEAVVAAKPAADRTPAAKPEPAKPAAPAPKPAAPAAKPASPPAATKPPAPVAEKPAPVPKAAPAPITEIRLTGSGFDLAVTEPGSYEIGRADDARLRLVNPTVSRQHARLIFAADRMSVQIEHVGKTTPTLLNGAVVARSAPLSGGEKILLGEVALTVTLKR